MQNQAPKIAAFDVDGTLTFTDSFMLFLRFIAGKWGFVFKLLGLVPIFLLYGIRIISRDDAKNHILSTFLKDYQYADYIAKCEEFAKATYPKIVRNDGMAAIKTHQGANDVVCLVSASLEDYLIPWAKTLGVEHVIATKMEVIDGRLSGKMRGPNCRAQGKVDRIREVFGDAPIVAAYGDSSGDTEMLEAAEQGFYRKLLDEPKNAKAIKNSLYWGDGFNQ